MQVAFNEQCYSILVITIKCLTAVKSTKLPLNAGINLKTHCCKKKEVIGDFEALLED